MSNDKLKILELENLSAGYDENKIIKDISFYIKESDIVAFLGANGSGKSTLLKAIMKLLKSTEGEIYFYKKKISKFSTKKIIDSGINILLQNRNTFSELTVWENIELINSEVKKKDIELKYEYLNNISDDLFFGLLDNELKNKRVGLLSGGERQKLAIFMLLVNNPKLILMDEPTSSLSVETVNRVMKLIKNLKLENNMTFIIVEQNIKSILTIANKIFIMKNGYLSSIDKTENLLLDEKLEDIFFK